jgi:hypothetical protein
MVFSDKILMKENMDEETESISKIINSSRMQMLINDLLSFHVRKSTSDFEELI